MSSWQRFDSVEKLIAKIDGREGTLLICVDAQIDRLYASQLAPLKSRANTHWFTFPPGEAAKGFAEWERALEYFLERKISRDSHLVAIGGGATSDVAGFVASTLLRGITWSVVPTTLLSQVDASIGGKVAINPRFGKNLVGNFHEPQNIYVCNDFLKTLDNKELKSGKGEVLKYAFLSKEIASLIENKAPFEEVVDACAKFKLDLVKRDLHEKGERKTLNLGHTFGHGIEWIYKTPHGQAVVWGMGIIFKLEGREDLVGKWKHFCQLLDISDLVLPWKKSGWKQEDILATMTKDKKNLEGSNVDLIVVKDIGQVTYEARSWQSIVDQLNSKQEAILALSLT